MDASIADVPQHGLAQGVQEQCELHHIRVKQNPLGMAREPVSIPHQTRTGFRWKTL
jgi:hypothetical protein